MITEIRDTIAVLISQELYIPMRIKDPITTMQDMMKEKISLVSVEINLLVNA